MLFDANQQLDERIVTLLGQFSPLNAQELMRRISKQKRYSIQGIYKELRKLEHGGVVVKEKQSYSLRIPWILEIRDFASTTEKHYITSTHSITTLPPRGKKEIRHFHNLLQLNNFWSQVLLLLMQKSSTKRLYTWMPHPWYHLIYTEQEQQYIDAVQRSGVELFIINHGQQYLDQYVEKFWKQPHIEYSFSNIPFKQEKNNVYLNVIDDYVLTVKLESAITKKIDQLYEHTHSADDIDFANLVSIFHQKAQSTMWLEQNRKKAQLISGRFHRHFGMKNNK